MESQYKAITEGFINLKGPILIAIPAVSLLVIAFLFYLAFRTTRRFVYFVLWLFEFRNRRLRLNRMRREMNDHPRLHNRWKLESKARDVAYGFMAANRGFQYREQTAPYMHQCLRSVLTDAKFEDMRHTDEVDLLDLAATYVILETDAAAEAREDRRALLLGEHIP